MTPMRWQLTASDEESSGYLVQCALRLEHERDWDLEAGQGALMKALAEFPLFSARVSYWEREPAIMSGTHQLRLEYEERSGGSFPNAASDDRTWSTIYPRALDEHEPGVRPGPNTPLLHAKLTVARDRGLAFIALAVNHGVCGAHGLSLLLRAWSRYWAEPEAAPAPHSWPESRSLIEQPSLPEWTEKDEAKRALLCEQHMQELGSTASIDPACQQRGQYALTLLLARPVIFRIERARLHEWKRELEAALPEGEWMSSFEMLTAMILSCRHVRPSAEHFEQGEEEPTSLALRTVVDIRGRHSGLPRNAWGNWTQIHDSPAATFARGSSSSMPGRAELVALARKVHAHVRGVLGSGDRALYAPFAWRERARRLGFGHELRFAFHELMLGRMFVFNSWDRYPWAVNMGTRAHVTGMHVAHSCVPNYFLLHPYDDTDLAVRTAMSAAELDSFCTVSEALGLPFELALGAHPSRAS